jgi:hypothetical protein
MVFQINYATTELESVFQCHNAPIMSLVCNVGCVVTGAADNMV